MNTKNVCVFIALIATILLCLSTTANADDKLKKMIKSTGNVTLRIIEADVPDMDPYPGQGDSDTFIRVATTKSNETLCESQIIQDKDDPKFNFDCTPKVQLPGDTVFLIKVLDSDKPMKDADLIGTTRIALADIIFNQRLDLPENYPIEGQKYPKHFLKVKVSYKPNDL